MPRQPTCVCGECKKCKKREYMRGWYQRMSPEERRAWVAKRDIEKVKKADRERYYRDWGKRRAASDSYQRRNPERIAAHKAEWEARNPEKRKAHHAVNNAVRDGRLVKLPCEKCGSTKRVHGHHDDYSKPLEVRWLCPLHHGELRRK